MGEVIEKRQYVRMSTVFPVEFEISAVGDKYSSQLLQGFTRDVSGGGMCIELKSFGKTTEKLFMMPDSLLNLTINPPFSIQPIQAKAKISWLQKKTEPLSSRYLIGVSYTEIDPRAKQRLLSFAKNHIWIPRLVGIFGILFLGGLAFLFIHSQRLTTQNKALVNQLVESAQKRSLFETDFNQFRQKETKLTKQLTSARHEIKTLETSIGSLALENENRKKIYKEKLHKSFQKQLNLSTALKGLRQKEQALKQSHKQLGIGSGADASEVLSQMTGWLRSHQNINTGLVTSFEGDMTLENWAFTYDQSLVCQAFLLMGETKRAEAILKFYEERAKRKDNAFLNAYHAGDGNPIEDIVHVGPNVWLGIAALQYDRATSQPHFLPLAKGLGNWLMDQQDSEGGFTGGPGLTWYSTEHNLDAYAFLGMLHKETQDEKYEQAQNRVLSWIKKYAYSLKDKRMNRGKGDATVSTDTFSWAIAALGPETLDKIDFDSEGIIDFAEKNCEVTVNYEKPNGEIGKASGFDFSKAQNLGRGGIISTEWTAQMIVAYRQLADYFKNHGQEDKADFYREKANFYLNELQKLVITSPSRTGQGRGCLPYASSADADTGHGWRTPKGKKTGSLAGTAYGVFAWKNYNPFNLK